jgi:hypothetical protein
VSTGGRIGSQRHLAGAPRPQPLEPHPLARDVLGVPLPIPGVARVARLRAALPEAPVCVSGGLSLTASRISLHKVASDNDSETSTRPPDDLPYRGSDPGAPWRLHVAVTQVKQTLASRPWGHMTSAVAGAMGATALTAPSPDPEASGRMPVT